MVNPELLRSPFPWFGGKSRVAGPVWERFGYDVVNYVEPFAGSLATLLLRPGGAGRNETVNDKDCFLANFFRSLQYDPEEVAYWASAPINEADLHAKHRWLVAQEYFKDRILHDPDYYDAKIAGWWVWGISLWIGSGWCVKPEWTGRSGVKNARRGIHRSGSVRDVSKQMPNLSGDVGASGRGVHAKFVADDMITYFESLCTRLLRVRVCCGDWMRIMGPSVTTLIGTTAVFLDPPYNLRVAGSSCAPTDNIYAEHDHELSARVREWAIANGDNPGFRIALCGYESEHRMPGNWSVLAWKANGGYGNQNGTGNRSAKRERIWFSPHCLSAPLFQHTDEKEAALAERVSGGPGGLSELAEELR